LSKTRVAILGSGNIGIDLAERLLANEHFEIVGLVGRRADSPGLSRMAKKGVPVFSGGLEDFLENGELPDGFFDATSAFDHVRHWHSISKSSDSWMIDLTPSRIGQEVVPDIDHELIRNSSLRNFNMITCGGQSSGPLLNAMVSVAVGVFEVEVSSSIASDSAGPATRRNLDHYIEATEASAKRISGVDSKAILVLNPAMPQVMMRTSVTIRCEALQVDLARRTVEIAANRVRNSVPGYEVILPPTEIDSGVFMSTVSVEGEGHYLPKYSGNLDIINAAAIQTAMLLEGRP
jgi:acetaldehyde dehydrogenase (acetylating)